MQLPEYQQPTRSGQPTPDRLIDPIKEQARQVAAAVDAVYVEKPTSYRDDTPLPVVGTASPVTQPGVPPMSQRATDISRVMLAAGVATVPPGLIAIGILVASEHADLTVIGMICAAPAALAIPILAVASLLRRAKDVLPAEHHHHYTGTVVQDQRSITTTTRGVIATTRNTTPN
ncbi:hypothetical protein [Streptomyces sp. NPDC002215]|uniref:hypothetical protein n=1 Tax=Streptomyces sp. NPDC002215 TaxID=3154412 RepID=UPI00331DBA7A